MSMPQQDLSSRHFQRKISDFCELRVAPIASRRVTDNIRPYLTSLIIYRKPPPMQNGRIDWTSLGQACGIEEELTTELKKQLQSALDAIIRWLKAPTAADDASGKRTSRRGKAASVQSSSTATTIKKPRLNTIGVLQTKPTPSPRGPTAKPISPLPEPLFEASDDPASFQDALTYQMRRFGDTYWQLYRAVIRLNETFDNKTLLSWIQGERVPRSVASFEILHRIEGRYRLREGYFKEKLPHQARSL